GCGHVYRNGATAQAASAVRRHAGPGRLLYRIIRLPGWTAIATGLSQLVILICCTVYGITNQYGDAARRYRREYTDLTRLAKDLNQNLGRMPREMQRLTNQSQQQPEPPLAAGQVPPAGPVPPAQPMAMDKDTALAMYRMMREKYAERSVQFQVVNQQLAGLHR